MLVESWLAAKMTDHTRRTCSATSELEDCQTTSHTSSIIWD
jgi:hypothetical protein